MAKDIQVLIIEDDPYARDLMTLLLTRDWRTHVIGEIADQHDLRNFIDEFHPPVDVAIVDTEIPGEPDLPFILTEILSQLPKKPAILYTGTQPNGHILDRLVQIGFGGYVIKKELLYALGSAVAAVARGNCIVTPGVYAIASRYAISKEAYIYRGSRIEDLFTRRESELVRLALIFNLSIRDMADELVLSPEWVSEVVSGVYKKLGLREILSGEVPLEEYFSDPAVLERCQEITQRTQTTLADGRLRKAPWMSTLAFHILTRPRIERY
ncbi:MAG: response regulator [Anaerolineales bacterium]